MAQPKLVTVAVLFAFMVAASFPTASFAVVTIGSDLAAAPNDFYRAAGPPTLTTLVHSTLPGRQTRSPINGVIVRWRLKTDGDPPFSPFALRVVAAPGVGVATGPQETPPAGPNPSVHTFNARLPIKALEYIGVDLNQVQFPPGGPFAYYLNVVPGGPQSMFVWSPALANGQTRPADTEFSGVEILVNADIEADADGDGFGDETQDGCAADPVPAGGPCTPPTLKLGGKKSQRALKQRGVLVEVGCPTEACTANAKGTVAVPGAAKVYKLRPATQQIAAGGKAKLKLTFAKQTLKAVKRALGKRKKIKAKVTVTAKDIGGNATTRKRTIKLKR